MTLLDQTRTAVLGAMLGTILAGGCVKHRAPDLGVQPPPREVAQTSAPKDDRSSAVATRRGERALAEVQKQLRESQAPLTTGLGGSSSQTSASIGTAGGDKAPRPAGGSVTVTTTRDGARRSSTDPSATATSGEQNGFDSLPVGCFVTALVVAAGAGSVAWYWRRHHRVAS
jgi:hypothetical protein